MFNRNRFQSPGAPRPVALPQAPSTAWALLLTAVFALTALTAIPAAGAQPDHLGAAQTLLRSGDAGGAARLLAARVATRPDDLSAQTWLTVTLDRLVADGEVAAVEGVNQVLPAWPPVLERLGRLYADRGRDEDAEDLYRTWIVLRPGNPEPYARLAEHELARRHYDKAIALFERHRVLVGGESDYAERRIAAVHARMNDTRPEWPPAARPAGTVARAR
jgi:tetratricopeptide (TPR) repeat protein